MGREQSRRIARGVRLRKYASGKVGYEIQFQYRGVQCKEVLALQESRQSERYCVNLKAEIENAIERNTFRYTDYFPDSKRARLFGHVISDQTMGQLMKDFLKDAKRAHPHSTYRAYEKACKSWLIPALGPIRATDLAPTHIKDMLRERKVALKTLRNDLTPLRTVLGQALGDGIIARNPIEGIKVHLFADRDNESDYEVDPFSMEEIQALLNVCATHRPEWLPYWQHAFFTGLRPSELYSEEWANVDWRRQTALIKGAIVERKAKETKTKSSARELELLPAAYQALVIQRKNTELKSNFIWQNPKTGKPICDYEETQQVFSFLQKKAGVRRRTQYQTRHSFASNLLSGGENPWWVAMQMGHKDVQMIMKTYGRWVEQGRQHSQQRISGYGTQNGTSVERGKQKGE